MAALGAAGTLGVASSGVGGVLGGSSVGESLAQALSSLATLESAFLAMVVGASASLAARLGISMARSEAENQRQRLEDGDYKAGSLALRS